MKILAIMGSNNEHGNTSRLFNSILEHLSDEEVTVIDVNRVRIEACIGCDYCLDHQGECIIKNDDMDRIYQQLLNTDLVLIVAPVYFTSFPSRLKALIDRCQMLYNLKDKNSIRKKGFAAVHIGGSRPYPEQFAGLKGVYKYWIPDFNAEMIGFVGIPGTDAVKPEQNTQGMTEIDGLIKIIKTGDYYG
ncbi:MAG: flavodoxin family protein [Eubacteriaceae bacterium]|jgi:multimeric flavodoxin WrbA